MAVPDNVLRRLIEPPSADLLQRVARELYEIEPLRYGGKYGDGEFVVEWDSPLLSDEVRKRCARYAAAIIASWQKAVMELAGG